MKIFKSHFWYNKRQRNGTLFLVLLIVTLQVIYTLIDFSREELMIVDKNALLQFQKEIDSLKLLKVEKRKFKLYPFNPNYISDFKGYQLGMSVDEIDRLHRYRKQRKFINSKEDFKKVTGVSDSLLAVISPLFKFPEWVQKKEKRKNKYTKGSVEGSKEEKKIVVTVDINKANREDFESVNGIGEVLSNRIIKYRSKLQGFSFVDQLDEVWGLDKYTVKKLKKKFKIVSKPIIQKLNVNTASFKEILRLPYINYELCKDIFEYRDEVAELQNISELRNIKDFPLEKYDRIVLYLEAK